VLTEYVDAHTARGVCRCGKCFDRGGSPDPTGHVADLVFFPVAATNSPTVEEFVTLTKEHVSEFFPVDPLDGDEHNYMEIGGWIGSQEMALRYMGLGALLGVFTLMTPKTLIPAIIDAMAIELAEMGMVSAIHAKK
jgi:hypothetical protein